MLFNAGVLQQRARRGMDKPEKTWRILRYQRVLIESAVLYPPSETSFVLGTNFVDQIHYLKHNCRVIKLEQLLAELRDNKKTEPFTVALTFDGGYAEHFRGIAPFLDDLGLPATFFVATGLIGSSLPAWPEALMAMASILQAEQIPLSSEPLLKPLLQTLGVNAGWELGDNIAQAERLINRVYELHSTKRDFVIPELRQALRQIFDPRFPPTFASWEHLQDLNPSLFSLGIMGTTGESLSELTEEELGSEILTAQETLKQKKVKVEPWLSFPHGLWNPEHTSSLSSHGIEVAFALETGSRGPILHRSHCPVYPRLANYQSLVPNPIEFLRLIWEIPHD